MPTSYHHALNLFIIAFIFIAGCTTTKNVEVPNNNLRRQMELQSQLQKLNLQNEKLQQLLTEASVINIESAEALENKAITNEKAPEINAMLQEYKKVNKETQDVLNSIDKSIRDDTGKNTYIKQMLDGLEVKGQQQQARLDGIRSRLNTSNEPEWRGDNVHIGISPQFMAGYGSIYNNDSKDSEDYAYNGSSGTAYFTYVGDSNSAFGFKYMVLAAELRPDTESNNGGYYAYDARLGLFSVGYRIPSIKTFNIVPEILYGVGESTIKSCDNTSCASGTYFKSAIRAVGIELPFYHQLGSTFSWGFKISGYKIMSDKTDYYENETKQAPINLEQEYTVAGVGLMLGLAW